MSRVVAIYTDIIDRNSKDVDIDLQLHDDGNLTISYVSDHDESIAFIAHNKGFLSIPVVALEKEISSLKLSKKSKDQEIKEK